MPKIPFSELLPLKKQTRFARANYIDKEIKKPVATKHNGLDTETLNGYVKLICDDERFKMIECFDDIVQFLFHQKYDAKFNWFYNIKYDFESMIKYLDKDELLTLYVDKEIKINVNFAYSKSYPITVRYLDKKFFSLSDGSHTTTFYDLYNFLDTSLDNASKKFLNETKNKDVDSSKLNIDRFYWVEKEKEIIKYCMQDALLTKKLAIHFWNKLIYKHMNFVPKKPFSKGKLSEEYFCKNCYIPTINGFTLSKNPEKNLFGTNVLEYAYNSYFGGRFELIKKGYFEKVYTYDIKSAYPYQMANLIDFTKGKWKAFNKKINPDAYTGFYKVHIDCNEICYSPIVIKKYDLNLYPNGSFNQYLSKQEIDFIDNHFDNVSLQIIDGYEFFINEDNILYPFKDLIEHLYHWKETEKDEDIRYVVKIILNSLYGKTIQVIGDKTGNLFNPIYASLITSGTRIKLLDLAYQNPDAIIMFSTDGVHSEEKLKVNKNPSLGDFASEFEGRGVYIMSDIYNIWNDTKTKNKLRGFSLASEKDIDSAGLVLKDILAKMNSTKYTYETSRPFHLAECLIHTTKRRLDEINVWGKSKKTINVNGDRKRVWEKEFASGKDCLKEKILSLPLVIE